MTITEKVSYLKGLAEGLSIDDTTKEGKIIKAIIDVLDDVAFSVADLEDGLAEVCDQVDLIDEDLEALEEEFYGDEDECDCDGCSDEDFDGDLYEVQCPPAATPSALMKKLWSRVRLNAPTAVSFWNLIWKRSARTRAAIAAAVATITTQNNEFSPNGRKKGLAFLSPFFCH